MKLPIEGNARLWMEQLLGPSALARAVLALHPRIKRLFVSGYTSDVIAHHGVLEAGVHFLQKPATVGDLTTRVREVLDQP